MTFLLLIILSSVLGWIHDEMERPPRIMNKSHNGRRLANEEWKDIIIHTDYTNFQSTPV